METRESFAEMPDWQIGLWYGLILLSVGVFFWGAARLVRKYRNGRRSGAIRYGVHPWRALRIVLTHTWIFRRAGLAGIAHVLVFYGFMVLFAGTVILAIQDDVARPLFDYEFFRGSFYLGYSLFLDVFGMCLLVGVGAFIVWRLLIRPARTNRQRAYGDRDDRRLSDASEDWVLLGALLVLGVTGFLLEAFRIAETNPGFEKWSPMGWLLAKAFRSAGLVGDAAGMARQVQWWVHGVAALAFTASIPFWKALHMLTAPANIALRDERAGKELPPLTAESEEGEAVYSAISDLTQTHLLSLDACTRCGKCHVACPATGSSFPLSPRDLVLDLKQLAARSGAGAEETPIVGGPIGRDTIWSCMQCMACVDICPVGIEHVPIINQVRRGLVEKGDMDSALQSTLEAVYNNGNSFAEPRRKRPRWAKDIGFEIKDARKEPVEHLWFVGDYASFDSRNQRATLALARTLNLAGVDFGILWEAERTAGCDVRRAGEEGLWESLAEENIKTLSGCEFGTIFSSDPHTFHTLKNEYPALGGEWPVMHHTQLLVSLLASGAVPQPRQLGYRATFHDPCTLGRYNGVFDEPRKVLEAIGVELVEMPRNRSSSLCCGAGGGRIWMAEPPGLTRRPSELRIDEALGVGGLDYFVVACPKDVSMYEDAIKTSGHEGKIELRELSELVWEALAPPESVAITTTSKEGADE